MNILMLSWRDIGHPNAGGAEIATHEHAKAWVKAGYNVIHFAANFKNAKREELVDGVKYTRFGYQYVGVQLGALFWYLFGDHPKFDLVVDQFHGIPFFTPIYVRVKKLAYIHEATKEIWKLNPWPKLIGIFPSFFGPILEPWIFRLLYRDVVFMTVSESTKNDLVEFGVPQTNINVIHNGIKVLKPARNINKEKKKTAIYLGAIAKDKGIEDAIRVFSEINKLDGKWQFWVVGKASQEFVKNIEKWEKDYGLKNKLKYWGFVSEKKKFELLTRAHVLVNPSIREGWGLVNIEANAVSTPVIGYKVAGVEDSVINGETGILVKKSDYMDLAKKAGALINNSKKYKRMRRSCVLWARRFSWQKSTSQSLRVLEGLRV